MKDRHRSSEKYRMSRRKLLMVGGATSVVGLSGCLGGLLSSSGDSSEKNGDNSSENGESSEAESGGNNSSQGGTDTSTNSWRVLGYNAANTKYAPSLSGPNDKPGLSWSLSPDGLNGQVGGIVATDTNLYTSTKDKLYSINPENGGVNWRHGFDFSGTDNDVEPGVSSPVVAPSRNSVYVSTFDGKVHAFSTEDGSKKWSEPVGSSAIVLNIQDDTLFIVSGGKEDDKDEIIVMDIEERSPKTVYSSDHTLSVPIVGGDLFYITELRNKSDSEVKNVSVVRGFETSSGNEIWKKDFKRSMLRFPAYRDGNLYFNGSHFLSLDANTGEKRWEFKPEIEKNPDDMRFSYVVVGEQNLYIVWKKNENRILSSVNASDGKTEWATELRKDCNADESFNNLIGADGTIYLSDTVGRVSAYNMEDGSFMWRTNPLIDSTEGTGVGTFLPFDNSLVLRTKTAVHRLTKSGDPIKVERKKKEPSRSEFIVEENDGSKTYEIEMTIEEEEFYFDPIGLYIQPGDTVRWVSKSNAHSTTAYDNRIPEGAEPWDSKIMEEGESFEHTFEREGTYDYFCKPHKALGMVGRIVVGEPGGPAEDTSIPQTLAEGGMPQSDYIVENGVAMYPYTRKC